MSALAPPPAAPPAFPAAPPDPPASPPGAPRAALARLLVRLAAVLGLALLGALGWVGMLAADPAGRAWAWVGAGVAGAAGLVLAGRLPPRVRPAAAAGVAALLTASALPLAGIPLDLLRPRHWDELAGGVGRGLEALPELAIPHAGPLAGWPARTLLLLGALLVVLAVLAAAWPRRDGRAGLPLGPAVPLGILVGAPAVVLPGGDPVLQGLVLFLGLVALLAAERVARGDVPVAAAALAAAALAAVVLQPALDADEPWFDYEAAAGRLAASPVRFSWGHEYGPLTWSREGREMFRARSPRARYWKAQDLEGFDGVRWRAFPVRGRSDGAYTDLLALTTRNPGDVREYEVAIRGLRTEQIVSPGQALGVTRAPRDVDPGASVGTFVSERPLREGDSYRVRAYVPRARPAVLRAASTSYGEELFPDRTVALPAAALAEPGAAGAFVRREIRRGEAPQLLVPAWGSGLAPQVFGSGVAGADATIAGSAYAEVWALAQRLRAESPTPYAYARRIESHLSRGFRYTESPRPARVPLADFLLRTRQGYCQHFSGAMALLLRMGGVPARVAAGFAPGRRDGETDEWVVRDVDAHSWVEAYFPGSGWATFDPTPAASPARGQETTNRVPELLAGLIGGQQASGRNLGQGRGGASTPSGGAGAGLEDDGGVPWPLVLLAAASVLAAGALLAARRRRAPGARRDALVLELERALRRSGRPLRRGTTLSQLEQRFARSPDAAGYVRAVRARRFGAGSEPPTPAQRRGLRRELARGLGPLGRARGWWAVPPRAATPRRGEPA